MLFDSAIALALLQFGGGGFWGYWGIGALICAVIGYFISGLVGLLLGLFFGPIGLLIAFLLRGRA
jgi:hypothetical protein